MEKVRIVSSVFCMSKPAKEKKGVGRLLIEVREVKDIPIPSKLQAGVAPVLKVEVGARTYDVPPKEAKIVGSTALLTYAWKARVEVSDDYKLYRGERQAEWRNLEPIGKAMIELCALNFGKIDKPKNESSSRGLGLRYFWSSKKDEHDKTTKLPRREIKEYRADQINRQLPHIASGASGVVYKGHVKGHDEIVAIKDMPVTGPELFAEWKNEIEFMSQHPIKYIVTVYGYSIGESSLTIIMEFLTKGTLYGLLHESTAETSLSFLDRLRMGRHAAIALAHLHEHNIMHHSNNLCKLADFGTAKAAGAAKFHTERRGTPLWMAPEVKSGGQYSLPADVFSLGVVLYEIFTLSLPDYDDASEEVLFKPHTYTGGIVVESMINSIPSRRPPASAVKRLLTHHLTFILTGKYPDGDTFSDFDIDSAPNPSPQVVLSRANEAFDSLTESEDTSSTDIDSGPSSARGNTPAINIRPTVLPLPSGTSLSSSPTSTSSSPSNSPRNLPSSPRVSAASGTSRPSLSSAAPSGAPQRPTSPRPAGHPLQGSGNGAVAIPAATAAPAQSPWPNGPPMQGSGNGAVAIPAATAAPAQAPWPNGPPMQGSGNGAVALPPATAQGRRESAVQDRAAFKRAFTDDGTLGVAEPERPRAISDPPHSPSGVPRAPTGGVSVLPRALPPGPANGSTSPAPMVAPTANSAYPGAVPAVTIHAPGEGGYPTSHTDMTGSHGQTSPAFPSSPAFNQSPAPVVAPASPSASAPSTVSTSPGFSQPSYPSPQSQPYVAPAAPSQPYSPTPQQAYPSAPSGQQFASSAVAQPGYAASPAQQPYPSSQSPQPAYYPPQPPYNQPANYASQPQQQYYQYQAPANAYSSAVPMTGAPSYYSPPASYNPAYGSAPTVNSAPAAPSSPTAYGLSNQCRVLYSFVPEHNGELAVIAGEVLTILKVQDVWLQGRSLDGRIGWVPLNYTSRI